MSSTPRRKPEIKPTLIMTRDSSEMSINIILHGVTSTDRVIFNLRINPRFVCDATFGIRAALPLVLRLSSFNFRYSLL
jgi:hypothetical protein